MSLLVNLEKIFAEIEDHQINLETLQRNQSAGSFLDEISKWQEILKDIEEILHEWNSLQTLWLRLTSLNSSVQFDDSTSLLFNQVDRHVRRLNLSLVQNNNTNLLECCQKKSNSPFFLFRLTLLLSPQISLPFSNLSPLN